MFMLVATGSPFTAFWWPTGYLRLSLEKYSTDNTDRTGHLTNQAVQKHNENFAECKEESVWTFDQFQQYLTAKKIAPPDWVKTTFRADSEACLQTLMTAVQGKTD